MEQATSLTSDSAEGDAPRRAGVGANGPIRLALLVTSIVLAGAGVVAAFVVGAEEKYPSSWDPRIVELVSFVERERGLEFDHPVFVDFLDAGSFRRELTEEEESTEEDRVDFEQAEGFLRALGLVHGDIDLEQVGDDLLGEGVVGFYRFEDERIAVRGETLDDERRATLVHELTHALQDQHFDIGARDPEPSGAASALRALIEADAEAVSEAWVATLPAAKREALLSAVEATGEEADLGGVPEVFAQLATYPYLFGPVFFDHVVEERGERARDEMFRDPPTTEEHILRPETYLTNQRATAVPPPPLQEGEESIEDGEDDFGALSLLVVLAQRVDFVTAWEAVQGWAGDASVAFERAGVTCVRVDVVFDEPSDAGRFGTAFEQWAGGTGATGSVDGARARFESCDPGPGTQPPPADHLSGIEGLLFLTGMVVELEGDGWTRPAAECMAKTLLRHFGSDRVGQFTAWLDDQDDAELEAELIRVVAGAAGPCGAPIA